MMYNRIMTKLRTLLIPLTLTLLLTTACAAEGSRPSAETWAFCGVHPADARAQTKANTLARSAGIDATFGPCMPPDWSTYSPAHPGQRYIDPIGYLALTVINANAGMKTIVYDERIWSTDPAVRQAAIDFWSPHRAWIRAWDMGDEFDPASPDWALLVQRWNTVLTHVTSVTGVGPFTNHLGNAAIMNQALVDMPAQAAHLSYDLYDVPESLVLAREFDSKTSHLMCAINALDHGPYRTSAWGVESQMLDHREAGCDSFLIFGGELPINTPGFSTPSLLNPNGTPTVLADAVARGAR